MKVIYKGLKDTSLMFIEKINRSRVIELSKNEGGTAHMRPLSTFYYCKGVFMYQTVKGTYDLLPNDVEKFEKKY